MDISLWFIVDCTLVVGCVCSCEESNIPSPAEVCLVCASLSLSSPEVDRSPDCRGSLFGFFRGFCALMKALRGLSRKVLDIWKYWAIEHKNNLPDERRNKVESTCSCFASFPC